MKNILIIIVIVFCACSKKEDPKPTGAYTAESRPVTIDMYNFIAGKWHYCVNNNTFVDFRSYNMMIGKIDGQPQDTFWYKLDRITPNGGDNIIRSWTYHDSIERGTTFIEWKSDNTFYISGGQYCR